MFIVPNLLSILRFPLAFLFLQENVKWRCLGIFLAMTSDGLDGYLARKFNVSSRLGAILDPLMDKFFVFFILLVLISEGTIGYGEVAALMCRDFSVILFGCYLASKGKLLTYEFRSIWCGKITTFFQFIVLLGLSCQIYIPSFVFSGFIFLGLLALVELYTTRRSRVVIT